MDVPFKDKGGRQKTAATEAPGEQAQYALGEQIGFYLRQANQRHVAIFASLMAEKLTTTQWAALVRLKELQPCSQGNLGRETAMDMATIKGVVDRLVKRGLVHTAPDSSDARRLVLTLTPEGEVTVARNLSVALQISQETLSTLTLAERMMLMELLQKIC
ncbi:MULTISPECIES: MarR family winged helix-turn-helix transcriptional regulator [Rhizobium]|uniref:DNA-binding MarR family transcriptional regulator n=1 Tax=Rhizobium esperanzae TaxID=1967781 RepID=A0A7W6UIX0_9HYPH|nr:MULTISPECIES: MarR family transcriptional regulator [Rhizobium]MBB4438214.1 DNA-binding MarR family transcriptional regulator [Rhizobium esperanzae]MDH6201034.1 DNA-binding MarR family transcriptional regulator [Rhizobium leguminosarum]OAV52127.1 MarR family transcriptional regulator [Rhizobium sp. WYCCWR10014]